MSEQQHIACYELEHRIWDALDALSTGTWTPEDVSAICYVTGLNYQPPKRNTNMPKLSEMTGGKYLKQQDFPAPKLLTLTHLTKEQVNLEEEPVKFKWVGYFKETDRGLVMGTTKLNMLAAIFGSDVSEDWHGPIVVYTNPNVMFGGKVTGGLEIRAPKKQTAPEKIAEVAARETNKRTFAEEMDDDSSIPF